MASLRWIAGFSCLLAITVIYIGSQVNNPEIGALGDGDSQPLHRLIFLKLLESDSDDSPRIIASPQLTTAVNQEFSVEVPSLNHDSDVNSTATLVTGKVGQCVNGLTPVSLTITLNDNPGGNDQVRQICSERVEVDFELELPGSRMIQLGSGRQCEVMIR